MQASKSAIALNRVTQLISVKGRNDAVESDFDTAVKQIEVRKKQIDNEN